MRLLLLLLLLLLLVLLGRVIRLTGGLSMEKGETARRFRRKEDRRTGRGRMVVWLAGRGRWWGEFLSGSRGFVVKMARRQEDRRKST